MKPIHLALIAGIGFLLLKRRQEAVKLPPVTVHAPVDKPIPFPTSFEREQMPEPPKSRSENLFSRIFADPDQWSILRGQGQI